MSSTSRTSLPTSPRSSPSACPRPPRGRTSPVTGRPARVPSAPRPTSTTFSAGTPMRPLLGELLAAATEHIGAATSDALRPPTEATGAVVTELARLTALMARSPDAFVTGDHTDPPDPPDAQALTVLDARSALRHAAARTHT